MDTWLCDGRKTAVSLVERRTDVCLFWWCVGVCLSVHVCRGACGEMWWSDDGWLSCRKRTTGVCERCGWLTPRIPPHAMLRHWWPSERESCVFNEKVFGARVLVWPRSSWVRVWGEQCIMGEIPGTGPCRRLRVGECVAPLLQPSSVFIVLRPLPALKDLNTFDLTVMGWLILCVSLLCWC